MNAIVNFLSKFISFFKTNFNFSNVLKKYFSFMREDSNFSQMRFVSTLMVATACFIIIWQCVTGIPIDWVGSGSFATAALLGKWMQKKDELKSETTNSTPSAVNAPVVETKTDSKVEPAI